MRIAAEISPHDHQDFIRFLAGEGSEEAKALEGVRDLSRTRLKLYLAMAAFLGTVVWFAYRRGLDGLLDRPFALTLILVGLLCVPVAILWLMSVRQSLQDLEKIAGGNIIDQNSLREGLNIGTGYFDFDRDGITFSLALVEEHYTWRAFQELRETSTAFHLMIDAHSGCVVPKRAFGDDLRRREFEAFVAARIGAGG
jgi:hypothetical protein